MINPVDIVIAGKATAVVIVVIALVARRVMRDQARLQGEMRDLARLKRAELALLLDMPMPRGPAAPPTSEEIETAVSEILTKVESGPYVRHHVRPDLPPEVSTLRWHSPEGPIVVTAAARPRDRASG